MSEFHVSVIRLGKIGLHPNADSLSITQVGGKYPVVIKTGDFQPGDLAVHIPPDALVPVDRPEFSWLADKAKNGVYRVRFSKLRGVPSYGFLIPMPSTPNSDEAYAEGQDIRHVLGVTKYDPGPCYQLGGEIAGDQMSIPQEGIVPHYDIEGLRKYESLLAPGEEVIITEKVHGSNGRWLHLNGQLFCGSRTKFRKDSVWNKMAEKYRLEEVLGANPGLVLYGEVYGPKMQDLTYGLTEPEAVFFDIYDTTVGLWWDWERFAAFCDYHNLPVVPVLKSGPFDAAEAYELAEGVSVLHMANYEKRNPGCAGVFHVREGVVIKPVKERWSQEIGRTFLKLPGESFLLRKSA